MPNEFTDYVVKEGCTPMVKLESEDEKAIPVTFKHPYVERRQPCPGATSCTQAEQALDNPEPYQANAYALLNRASMHMRDRAKQYDGQGGSNQRSDAGERSMAATVAAFNAICGHHITATEPVTESQGWLFMILLKLVRSENKKAPHADSIEDAIAYCSLYGEARLAGK